MSYRLAQTSKGSSMASQDRPLFNQPWLIPVMLVCALCLYLARQFAFAPDVLDLLHLPGNDDAMRLQMVRDLMAGQGWFDTRQYRVLPPEGISLHWSRLVDAPMAAILWILSLVMDTALAERWLTVIWPSILFAVLAYLTARVSRIGFGVSAAVIALISLWFIQSYHGRYFPFGRLDHHNLQLILMLALFGSLFSQRRDLALLGGGLAALSLAIGMESLVFVGVVGLVHVWRYLKAAPGGRAGLSGYGIGLGVMAPVFFVVQTPLSEWSAVYCDQLSLPFLWLTTTAGVLGFAVLLGQHSLWVRIGLLALATGFLALFALPVLTPCFAGPFADVPEAVRDQVIARIGESASLLNLWKDLPAMAAVMLLPLAMVTVLTIGIWMRQSSGKSKEHWGVLSLFLLLGVVGAVLQLRALIWGHAVLAVGFGAVAAHLINVSWPMFRAIKVITLTLVFIAVFMPQLIVLAPLAALRTTDGSASVPGRVVLDVACTDTRVLAKLDQVDRSVMLTPLNLGAGVLVHTHHAVTAAPYHRDTRAMLNGVLPFEADGAALMAAVEQTGASHVLVCDGQIYGSNTSIGTFLSRGNAPSGLATGNPDLLPLRVYRVTD